VAIGVTSPEVVSLTLSSATMGKLFVLVWELVSKRIGMTRFEVISAVTVKIIVC
jgi:hypothetical protein